MALSRSLWHDDEAVNHWRRVGELGMEEGLRKIGCSESLIIEIQEYWHRGDESQATGEGMLFDVRNKMDNDDAFEKVRATILATVGRRERHTSSFNLGTVDVTENDLIAFCVNISSNTNISTLYLEAKQGVLDTVEGCTALGGALALNCSVEVVWLEPAFVNIEACRFLLDGLRSNRTLNTICIKGEGLLTAAGVSAVAEFLTNNSSALMSLKMHNIDLDNEAGELMSSALSRNTNLRDLTLRIQQVQNDGMVKLLQPFSGQAGDDTASSSHLQNSTITNLDLVLRTASGRLLASGDWLESVVHMIRTNKSLSRLRLSMKLLPQEWKEHIFPALKANETIVVISLGLSEGLQGDDVFEALMDVLQNNESKTRLEAIYIYGTEMESKRPQVDEELRINKQYRYALRGQKSEPTTFGRLVMCGFQYAGKTTICEALQRIDSGAKGNHPLRTRWKRLLQKSPSLLRILFGEDAYLELEKRTRGCDILVLSSQKHLKAIWDFAGQSEYYALHDYLFPDMKNSCFLYVCSCLTDPTKESPKGTIKKINEMRDECVYWLKFIASNSKPFFASNGQGRQLPGVIFVLTKTDLLGDGVARHSIGWAKTVFSELKKKFKDVVDLCDDVQVVNALCQEDVIRLLEIGSDHLGKILKDQKEYNLCRDIRDIFSRWSSENPLKPVLGLQEFNDLCKRQFFPDKDLPPGSEEKWQVVLIYFDDIGEIIFQKGLSFIVTNPRWFGVGIVGYLIDAFKGVQIKSGGISYFCPFPKAVDHDSIRLGVEGVVERTSLEILLQNSLESMHLQQSVNAEQLIELLSKLEMCFELDEGNDSRLFLPALFDDAEDNAAKGQRQLSWKIPLERSTTYLGRRLQIENKIITFLSPGFFPRLQVHLRNSVHENGWIGNIAFTVARNLIQFAGEGVEVCVEYSGGTDYFVDILAQSPRPYEECLRFIEERVVKVIRQFCASPQGCQGVTLVEAIIRPGCVVRPHLCKDRKEHSVLVSKLEEKQAGENGYMHTWDQTLEDMPIYEFALDLLKGKGAYKRSIASDKAPKTDNVTSSGSKVLLQVELPKHFYPSIDDVNIVSKVIASLNVSKVLPIRLHILCDYTDPPHKVTCQPGREFVLNWKNGGYHLSIAKVAVSLLWTAVSVGAQVAGVPQVGFSHVEKLIDDLFTTGKMSALDVEILHRMDNPGKALEKISEAEILKTLAKYWTLDPHTEDLRMFLNLSESDSFWEDFRLHKVEYLEEPNLNTIGWVCGEHFEQGLRQKCLVSRPHCLQ